MNELELKRGNSNIVSSLNTYIIDQSHWSTVLTKLTSTLRVLVQIIVNVLLKSQEPRRARKEPCRFVQTHH
jgi:hypothetical protein